MRYEPSIERPYGPADVESLRGSVTASEYSGPVTIEYPSKTPLPNALLEALTLCIPQPPVPSPGQFSFSQGMNAYWMRYGFPSPSMLEVAASP